MSHEITREVYPYIHTIQARWLDFDILGHVNNVEYYRYFEAAIIRFLVDSGLDWIKDPVIPFAAETGCRFIKATPMVESVDAGLRVAHLGRSSMKFELGIFIPGDPYAYATGFFVHVYVDRATEKAVAIPEKLKRALESIS
ncbi:MAG: thioesterase family protein [Arenicellales bacterium]|jgi:acyl-CoA thioester hydrolase|nr:thioesterase family protein [Arenicellales bacterium]MDP7155984.1 thioesterase family protein [Arenicellales bacterium]MDP7283059.1 thioesterase family protein [Arenicellales bacterium]MDP7482017.1 thioesterase family protein [Arenicellales bacterium]MEE1539871.1 thioesterase family protein [Arenicellales bacterium]|tara:strand:+ start:7473 stop:7895 length:423 start_codon:yes stop_codon:yes gene_type:complete